MVLQQNIRAQYKDLPEPELRNNDGDGDGDNDNANHRSSYNISPTNIAPTYRLQKDGAVLEYMSWGLVPFWTRQKSGMTQYKTFNARKETVLEGARMWKTSAKHHRCVVPMDGYYEWLHKSVGVGKKVDKIPYYIKRKDNKLMFMAGLWSSAYLEDVGKDMLTFTIVTGPAPKKMGWLHHRMPIVLEPGTRAWSEWLSKDETIGKEALQIHDHDELEWFEVSKDVGKTTNNGPQLVKPLKKTGSIAGFFDKVKTEKVKPEKKPEKEQEEKKVKKEEEVKEVKEVKEENKHKRPLTISERLHAAKKQK